VGVVGKIRKDPLGGSLLSYFEVSGEEGIFVLIKKYNFPNCLLIYEHDN
jgi:hypothetical protein